MIDRTHPILAVVSRREFEQLSRQVQYGEIAWPQCYDKGKPIQLGRNHDNTTNDRRMLPQARIDERPPECAVRDNVAPAGTGPASLELRHGGGEETAEGG
jgi:hypothetical protein